MFNRGLVLTQYTGNHHDYSSCSTYAKKGPGEAAMPIVRQERVSGAALWLISQSCSSSESLVVVNTGYEVIVHCLQIVGFSFVELQLGIGKLKL